MNRRHLVVAALSLIVALGVCPRVSALNPSLDVTQYAHTPWKVRQGFAKGFIYSVAQTRDGYLWVGTESGLLRFDGIRAVPWRPPPGQDLPGADIPTLLAARDGSLWIGTFHGLARWQNGKLDTYDEVKGQRIVSLLQTRDGTVWIGTTNERGTGSLCALRDHRVECHGADGTFAGGPYPLYEDVRGNLWVGVSRGFYKWAPGRPESFAFPHLLDGHPSFGEDDRSVLIGTDKGIHRFVDGRIEGYSSDALLQGAIATRQPTGRLGMLRDRDGAIWIATRNRGLVHVHQGRADAFSENDGLSQNTVIDLLEDSEGTVWAVTPGGLDRFRDYVVPNYAAKQGLSNANTLSILAAKDGTIWIGTYNGLNVWNAGRISVVGEKNSAPKGARPLDGMCHALFQDRTRRIWVSTIPEFGYVENDGFVPIGVRGWVDSVAELPSEHLWVAAQGSGLFHVVKARLVETVSWASLGRQDFARVLLADRSGRGLWLGFDRGGVLYVENGAIRQSFSATDGLGNGRVNGLRFGARGELWADTAGGLSRIAGGRVTTLASKNGLPCERVHWSMEDDDGSLWLYMACGLVRVPRPEMDAWVADSTRSVKVMVFDDSEGVPSHSYSPEARAVTKSADGKIWFVAFDGVSVIDPRNLRVNTLAPPIHIEQVTADRESYDATPALRLPPLVRNLQIDYTATSLVQAERNTFRVMLEGRDPEWQDVGTRRQAFYTDLAPGSYRFRVKASNNSGVWNEAGTTLEFSIDPAYYQTRWFQALLVASTLGILWVAYLVRVRQVALAYHRRLDERVNERTRIARELHDTLLQSFHGLLLRFQTVSYLLPERPSEAKDRLDDAIQQAAKAITEGRDAVQGLRASTVERNDLAVAIRTLGDELATDPTSHKPSVFSVDVEGEPRDLHPIVRDEVYRIAAEALRNAYRHAHADRIEVEIRYDQQLFRLRVRDNGRGIDAKVLANQGSEGHYGLRGMPERAALIGGKLAVWSEVGSGTEIELRLPARSVYAASWGHAWLSRVFARAPRVTDDA